MKNSEENFFYSNGNEYSLVGRSENFAKARAMSAAKSLARILRVDIFQSVTSRTLRILGNDYQATTVVFTNSVGQTCAPEFSVPLDFAGDVRVWTNNRETKRVWSTVDKLEAARTNPKILFLFIAQRFNEFDESADDDIPF